MTAPIEQAIAELESRFGEQTAPMRPLAGGITNENVVLTFEFGRVVLRRAGAGTHLLGIDRGDELHAARNAAELGVGPRVLAALECDGSLVAEFLEAVPLEPATIRGPRLEAITRMLRKVHDGPGLPGRFSVPEIVRAYRATAREAGVGIHALEQIALDVVEQVSELLSGGEHEPVSCHNDLLAANWLDDGAQLWLIDWEYAGSGDRYFDLANLAVNNEFSEADEVRLLEAYFGEAGERRLARLRLMRIASDAREAYWGLVQQGVSELDVDYAAYADTHFRRLADAAAGGRLEQLLSAAR